MEVRRRWGWLVGIVLVMMMVGMVESGEEDSMRKESLGLKYGGRIEEKREVSKFVERVLDL